LTNKLTEQREKFEVSYDRYKKNKEQEDELKEQKIFKKYIGYVSYKIFNDLVFYHER
jgi:hypothetical protein